MKFTFPLLVLAVFVLGASAQCPGGICPAPQRRAAPAQAPVALASQTFHSSTRVTAHSSARATVSRKPVRNFLHRVFRHGS